MSSYENFDGEFNPLRDIKKGLEGKPGTDMFEKVNNPAHYNVTPVETIDTIQGCMTPEEFQAYVQGNILKYIVRYRHKGMAKKDLLKAQWYLELLIREVK